MIRTIVVLCIGIVALDAVESVISRSAGIPYAWFMLVQIVVYLGIGFVLRRRGTLLAATVLAAAVTALVEATLGEWVAVAIGSTPAMPLAQAVAVVPIVIVFESLLALGGFALGSIRKTA